MAQTSREKKSQRIFYVLIISLLLGYMVIKSWHISLAIGAYQGQPLEHTEGAAK